MQQRLGWGEGSRLCLYDQVIGEKAGDVGGTYADISHAEATLGYKPKVSLEDGLQQTVDWYKSSVGEEATV